MITCVITEVITAWLRTHTIASFFQFIRNKYQLHYSVEQYYNTVIIIDYQLQIPFHFGSTTKTEPWEYHFNLLTQSL